VTSIGSPGGRLVGYLEAIAAACLWGSSGIFAVHLFRLGVRPETVAFLRPAVGVLALALAVFARNRAALRVGARELVVLAVGGGAAVAVFQVSYLMSTDAVGVPTTVALLYLAPAIVAAAAGPLLREWPTARRVGLVALTVVGVWLSVLGAKEIPSAFGGSGLLWGGLAGVSYASYTLFGRFATPIYGSVPTTVYSTAGACVLLALWLPLSGSAFTFPVEARSWVLIGAFGVLTIGVAQFLFFDALGRIEASGASVATAAEPATAAVLATLILAQGLEPLGWLGICLIVAGVMGVGLSATPGSSRRP